MIFTIPSISFARESSISTKDLNHLIFSFQEKLSFGKPDYLTEAQKLYSLIFGPIESDLIQHNAKIIMISLDDALRYIPLSALHDGKKFVAEKYAISIYTPAANMDFKDKPQNKWRAMAMGVTKSLKGFKALPAVQKELDLIIQETDPLDKLGTLPKVQQLFINEQITRTATGFPTRGGNFSQQASMSEQREMRYIHPFYWAHFILIGNWL